MVLKHHPTGLVVRVHDSRDQLVNRKLARKQLYDRLDQFVNGETSKIAMREARVARTKDRARRRREKKENGEIVIDSAESEDGSEQEDEDFAEYDNIRLDKIGTDIK